MTRYLRVIHKTWAAVFKHNDDLAVQLNINTVLLLKARFPALSLANLRFLKSKWQTGSLFATITDVQARS